MSPVGLKLFCSDSSPNAFKITWVWDSTQSCGTVHPNSVQPGAPTPGRALLRDSQSFSNLPEATKLGCRNRIQTYLCLNLIYHVVRK